MLEEKNYKRDLEIKVLGLDIEKGNRKLTLGWNKVTCMIPLPESIFLSTQDHEALVERFIHNAMRVIRAGQLGPSAGWFETLSELDRLKIS